MLVSKISIPEEKILALISAIKQKKELNSLSDDFIRKSLLEYFSQNKKSIDYLNNLKSAKYKQIIKEVRAKLRKVYGLFRLEEELKKRRKLLEMLLSSPKKRKSIVEEILKTHSSTRERLPIYEKLYKKIFEITGKPTSITDLGSGINPFSFSFMNIKKCSYYAYDISQEEMNHLNKYFKLLHKNNSFFKGTAGILDALNLSSLKRLPKVNVCFLFKMTDVLDRGKGHKVTESVLTTLPADFVVISFATKTMSGKKMTAPRRKWMEWLCKRLGYEYKVILFANEIFYIIDKK